MREAPENAQIAPMTLRAYAKYRNNTNNISHNNNRNGGFTGGVLCEAFSRSSNPTLNAQTHIFYYPTRWASSIHRHTKEQRPHTPAQGHVQAILLAARLDEV